ncbi:MAG: formamidopyrimidine-DNA glycosylase [Acidimicrobiales bacterium]|nr:formamidopyrimidine-DNA glycosylase [Acidimicrobiales bacterium]
MPELPEAEAYRRLAEGAVGRRIAGVHAPDAWWLKGGLTASGAEAALVGRVIEGARRRGKLLLLETSGDGPVLGLRFGMTGRLLLDGRAGVDRLLHAPRRDDDGWDRFGLDLADGGRLVVRDPRRLGGAELDPDEDALGVDALAVRPAQLAAALAGGEVALKARLLDQRRLAGVGNLIADETLWRAGLDPARPAASLSPAEVRRLHRHLRATMWELIDRGGSHTGDLQPARVRGGTCPRDGTPLLRRTVGGRTTYSCPRHQR